MYTENSYHCNAEWSDEDSTYVARVLEFESLGAHSDNSKDEAIAELKGVVKFVLRDLAENGEHVPPPAIG